MRGLIKDTAPRSSIFFFGDVIFIHLNEKSLLLVSTSPFLLYHHNVSGDHEFGGENSLGEVILATSITAIKMPVIL